MKKLRDVATALGLFDETWYCERYPDVLGSGLDPFIHYLEYGWLLGRRASSSELLSGIEFNSRSGHDIEHSFAVSMHELIHRNPSLSGKYLDALDNFEGAVDYVTRAKVIGWAWCPDAPEEALWVEALCDGEVVGRARADASRPDLLAAEKGTGCYGFTINTDRLLSGDSALVVRVAHGGTPELPWSVMRVPPKQRKGATLSCVDTLVSDHSYFTSQAPEYEDPRDDILSTMPSSHMKFAPTVIAYYLPQFHPVAENDLFWGAGFTDWRQLSRGLPRFPGHYQPRIPRDLGYYQLGNEEILKRQAKLALGGGVSAFCYYYYWFNGKRVLERPLETHLTCAIDMPFLIMWANENWTRTWDGFDTDVLLRQDYRSEDEDALIEDFARHFLDKRYLRLNGRPLLIIYNPRHVPEIKVTIERWRDKLLHKFGLDPLVFMAQAFDAEDPRDFGLDGAIEFPPHKLAAPHPGRAMLDAYSSEFSGRVIQYRDIVASSMMEEVPGFPLIKTAVPSWDNDARRPNRGLILEDISPAMYEAWISKLVEYANVNPIYGRPIVAINAWNEWAEAAYLEPDLHFGAAFLNATARGIVSGVASYAVKNSEAGSRLVGKDGRG